MTAPRPVRLQRVSPNRTAVVNVPRNALDSLSVRREFDPGLNMFTIPASSVAVVVGWARARGRAVEVVGLDGERVVIP